MNNTSNLPKGKENMDTKKDRQKLFHHLNTVLTLSEKKIGNKNNQDGIKQSWARIQISAVSAYGRLLDTEELEQRVEDLEEKLKNGVLIPNGNK